MSETAKEAELERRVIDLEKRLKAKDREWWLWGSLFVHDLVYLIILGVLALGWFVPWAALFVGTPALAIYLMRWRRQRIERRAREQFDGSLNELERKPFRAAPPRG